MTSLSKAMTAFNAVNFKILDLAQI